MHVPRNPVGQISHPIPAWVYCVSIWICSAPRLLIYLNIIEMDYNRYAGQRENALPPTVMRPKRGPTARGERRMLGINYAKTTPVVRSMPGGAVPDFGLFVCVWVVWGRLVLIMLSTNSHIELGFWYDPRRLYANTHADANALPCKHSTHTHTQTHTLAHNSLMWMCVQQKVAYKSNTVHCVRGHIAHTKTQPKTMHKSVLFHPNQNVAEFMWGFFVLSHTHTFFLH